MVGSQFEIKTDRLVRLGLQEMLIEPYSTISPVAMLRYDIFQSGFAHGFVQKQVAPCSNTRLILSKIQNGRSDEEAVFIPATAAKAAGNIVQIVDLVLSRIGDIAAWRNSFIAINPDVVDRIRKAPQEALQ